MKACNLAAIVLAAGLSSRMEKFKPLLSIGIESITERVISIFMGHGIDVYLVVGWRKNELISSLNHKQIKVIDNPDYRQGMFTSIRAGLRSTGSAYEGIFIIPVDIPLVRPSTIKMLTETFSSNPDKIVYPTFGGTRGHPVLLPKSLISDITRYNSSGNLKDVLNNYEYIALEVEVPDAYILRDIDTLEDYDVLLKQFQQYETPTPKECQIILDYICKVEPRVRHHGLKVSEVAVKIGQALKLAGKDINLDAVLAAAMLHDIAKGQSKHDSAGAQILQKMGFGLIADIVSTHSDLPEDNAGLSLEIKTVYLADKFVRGDKLVTIEERYRSASQRYDSIPEVETRIQQRKERANKVKVEFENILGYSLDKVVFQPHLPVIG